jgi:hypothetical protein
MMEADMVTDRGLFRWGMVFVAWSSVTALPAEALAQSGSDRIVPTTNFVASGYGTTGYVYRTEGDNENEFTASFNPIFLYQFQDKILFEAEFEFELQGGVTETGLEYAQVDYIANDNLVLVGGKFLIPFGVFGERLHPTWINKFPTSPPIFGHHVSEFGAEPIIPVLAGVGVMARVTARPGPASITFNGYMTNGPAAEEGDGEIPELEFPSSSSDNNTNKMVGGRLDLALPGTAEVNLSFFNGDYDENSTLDLTGWNVAGEYHYARFSVRGEYIQLRQEIETFEGFPTVRRHGLYGQTAYRIGNWEPVVRWTSLFDTEIDGVVEEQGATQVGIGLDYWLSPSAAVMVGYEFNQEQGEELDNDRVVVHFAFGF